MQYLHRHYHSWWRRGLWSLALVAMIMTIGTVGVHRLEGMPYLEAFYFMSMIATAQGPMTIPATAAGKLFVAMMAFISVGLGIAALGVLFGPFFSHLWHLSLKKIEEEETLLLEKMKKRGHG